MAEERERLDWATYGVAARELAQQVVDDGYRPDIVLSIARGGLVVAASLAYALDVKPCFVLNIEYYTGIDERHDEPIALPPLLNLDEAKGARVLIADDVADTGHTLRLVQQLCEDRVAEDRIAVLYEKPQAVVPCDYAWKATDRWIEFPWSSQPPLIGPTPRNTAFTRARPGSNRGLVASAPLAGGPGDRMRLTTHEQERLLIHVAADVAQRRRERGLKLNHPEAVAILTAFVLEGARDGRPVAELMETGGQVLSVDDVMDGIVELVDEVQVEATFPDGTKLVTLHHPIG